MSLYIFIINSNFQNEKYAQVHFLPKIVEIESKNDFVQRYMDYEIRAIMAQYMPLDNQPENSNQVQHAV
jgi:hypothetical protein